MINAEDIILTNCAIAAGLFPKEDQAERAARLSYCCTLHEQKIRELAKLLNDANLPNLTRLPVREMPQASFNGTPVEFPALDSSG